MFLRIATGLLIASLTAGAETGPVKIMISEQVRHEIDPRLFGQFLERPSWGGETGIEAAILPESKELDPRVARLMDDMDIPVIRFPGGTDLDFMDWTDMIDNAPGRDQSGRPLSTGIKGDKVSNNFGYDEFLRLANAQGSDVILPVNFRDGLLGKRTPEAAAEHAAALVAYCNAPLENTLPEELKKWPRLRARNGHPEPYNVRYFQIGNETWFFEDAVKKRAPKDPVGHWVRELERTIDAVKAVDPKAEIIVDAIPLEVAAAIHKSRGEVIDLFTIHKYHPLGIGEILKDGKVVPPDSVDAESIWQAWVTIPGMNKNGQATLGGDVFTQARELGYEVAMTEWNWNGWWAMGSDRPAFDSLFAKGLSAAAFLHAMIRNGDLIKLATQSMLVGENWNLSGIRVSRDGTQVPYQFPTGMVTELYSKNCGRQLLKTRIENNPGYEQPYTMRLLTANPKVAYLDVLATRTGDKLTVFLINRHFRSAQSTEITLPAAAGTEQPELTSLVANAEKNLERQSPGPNSKLVTRTLPPPDGKILSVTLPAASVSVLSVALQKTPES